MFCICLYFLTQVLSHFPEVVACLRTLQLLSLRVLVGTVHAAQNVVAQAAPVCVEVRKVVCGVNRLQIYSVVTWAIWLVLALEHAVIHVHRATSRSRALTA